MSALTEWHHKEQTVWFLDAFWSKFAEAEAENIWNYYQVMCEVDPNGADGNEVDEMVAHRYLEKLGMTLTALKMREALREIDIDFNRKVSMSEYLLYRYKEAGATVEALLKATGSDNQAALDAAQALVDEAQAKLETSQIRAEESRVAEAEAVEAENAVSFFSSCFHVLVVQLKCP